MCGCNNSYLCPIHADWAEQEAQLAEFNDMELCGECSRFIRKVAFPLHMAYHGAENYTETAQKGPRTAEKGEECPYCHNTFAPTYMKQHIAGYHSTSNMINSWDKGRLNYQIDILQHLLARNHIEFSYDDGIEYFKMLSS